MASSLDTSVVQCKGFRFKKDTAVASMADSTVVHGKKVVSTLAIDGQDDAICILLNGSFTQSSSVNKIDSDLSTADMTANDVLKCILSLDSSVEDERFLSLSSTRTLEMDKTFALKTTRRACGLNGLNGKSMASISQR